MQCSLTSINDTSSEKEKDKYSESAELRASLTRLDCTVFSFGYDLVLLASKTIQFLKFDFIYSKNNNKILTVHLIGGILKATVEVAVAAQFVGDAVARISTFEGLTCIVCEYSMYEYTVL